MTTRDWISVAIWAAGLLWHVLRFETKLAILEYQVFLLLQRSGLADTGTRSRGAAAGS